MSKYIKPPKREDCVWRKGPPPEVGWWPASAYGFPESIRWRNGVFWSQDVHHSCDAWHAGVVATSIRTSFPATEIEWTDRWWERKE